MKEVLPQVQYDPLSHILVIEKENAAKEGCVAVCTGGTSDIPVAEEAARTAEYFGANVERIYDVGVAGIHRLLSQQDRLRHANAIVAVAEWRAPWPVWLPALWRCRSLQCPPP